MKKIIKKNNVKKCYMEYSYWENKIINDENLWEGYFEDKEITKDSVIIYTGIFHCKKDILKSRWVTYPNIYMFLGFLQHVFIPTVYFNIFDDKESEFLIPISPFNIVAKEIHKYNEASSKNKKMEKFYYFLEGLWNKDNDEIVTELNKFIKEFNKTWDESPESKLFIKYFDKGDDIYEFIKKSIEWSFNEFVEEEIEMNLEQLKYTCNNLLDETLINRKFIHLLNNKVINLF